MILPIELAGAQGACPTSMLGFSWKIVWDHVCDFAEVKTRSYDPITKQPRGGRGIDATRFGQSRIPSIRLDSV